MANDDGPAGLSTSATPAGSSARGGTLCDESLADELGDLVDRRLRREPRRLAVSAAAEHARDRRDVELVDARTERDAPGRAGVARRLTDQHGQLGSLDRPEEVDDPLRVRLGGADLGKVRAKEVRDDHSSPLEHARTVGRTTDQLELRELERFVDLLEDRMEIGARFDELSGKTV